MKVVEKPKPNYSTQILRILSCVEKVLALVLYVWNRLVRRVFTISFIRHFVTGKFFSAFIVSIFYAERNSWYHVL